MDSPATKINYPWPEPPAPGDWIEVADGVIWIRVPLPMALDHVNCYALDDGDGWTVIDTGIASRKTRAIWEKILTGPLGGRPIRRLIGTHHHPDHVGLAAWFQQTHGADLLMSRVAWLMARMLTLDEQHVPTAENLAFWKSCGMDVEIYEARRKERPFNFADMVEKLPVGFTRLRQDDVLRMGGRDWDVHVGHGHAPHHLTFWSRDDNLVISGDQIIASISPNVGIYATEPGADPLAEWLESCARLQTLARADHLVLPGHKLPFTGLPTRMRQLIDNHHGALDRLRDHLKEPRTAAECFPPLFKRSIGAGEYGLALVEAMAHVSHLYQLGEALRTMRGDGAFLWQMREG